MKRRAMDKTAQQSGRSKTAEIAHIALPNDANAIGTVFGGRILHLMDMAASIAARRFTGKSVMTVNVDNVRFLRPILVGHVIIAKAMVNRAFKTSMEVGVKVFAEDTYSDTIYHACSGYFIFVAFDKNKKKVRIRDVIIHDEEQKRRWHEAEIRKNRKQNFQNKS